MRKPTREQVRMACIICAKIAMGDYFGAVQDLGFDSASLGRMLRPPWGKEPTNS